MAAPPPAPPPAVTPDDDHVWPAPRERPDADAAFQASEHWLGQWDDLVWAMWKALQGVRHGYEVLDGAQYSDFAQFCYAFSGSARR